jgi:hypothetical protein
MTAVTDMEQGEQFEPGVAGSAVALGDRGGDRRGREKTQDLRLNRQLP